MVDFCKNITEEIVMQILSRTPPKSLMRFKCIHKSWYSVINDPKFATKHLHLYNKQSSSTAFLVKRPVSPRSESSNENVVLSYLRLETYGDDEDQHFVVEDLIFPPFNGLKARDQFIELPGRDDSLIIISHCDGIIFLYLYIGDSFLYNPAIKEFKSIPPSCYHDCFWSVEGFGYDLKCKDYIILEIANCYGVNPPKAAIYTLGTDSWRVIKTDDLQTEETYFWPTGCDLYSKGVFYWFGYEERKDIEEWERHEVTNKQVMFLYDTADELFHIAMLPNSFNEPPCGVYDIHVALLNKSVALYGFSMFESVHSIQIWVTDNIRGGDEESWTKYLSVEPVDVVRRSLAFWKMDEVLMIAKDGRVVLYNLLTGKLKYFPIHGLHGDEIQGILCVDSIVSVKGKQ